jgi:hypothetical protein
MRRVAGQVLRASLAGATPGACGWRISCRRLSWWDWCHPVTPREIEDWGAPPRRDARHCEVGGSLRTTARAQTDARRTFRVDVHIAARTRFVVEY